MPAPTPLPAGDDSGLIASADAAAEAQAAAIRAGQAGAASTVTESSTASPERENELDKAFREAAAAEGKNPPAITEKNLGKDNNGVRLPIEGEPTPEELAAEERKTAETAAAAAEAAEAKKLAEAEAAKRTGEKPARRGLLDELAGDTAAKPAAEDPKKAYDDIKLRSDASPKTQETFDMVKARAAERETAVREQLAAAEAKRVELEGQVTELTKKAGALPEDAAKELKELREFRALHDVGSRPEFREKFDSRITKNLNEVYTLFQQEQMPEAQLAKLKALSEEARTDYIEKNVLPKLTAAQRQFVGAKLYDNVNVKAERAAALEAAKVDAEKILAEQKGAPARTHEERFNKIIGILKPIVEKMPYLHLVDIPGTATEAEKKELQAHNDLATVLQEDLKAAVADETPQTRAEAAIAVPMARYYFQQFKVVLARAEAAEGRLAKITAASATGRRLGQSTTSAPAAAPVAKTSDDSGDAIDNLFKVAAQTERSAR